MRYFAVFFLFFFTHSLLAQDKTSTKTVVKGTIINDNTLLVVSNANIINVNKVKGTISNARGYFELEASVNDTLHISLLGYQSLKVRVTNDWINNGNAKIQLTEKAIALEEVVVRRYDLTGYLEIDSKLIPDFTNRWSVPPIHNVLFDVLKDLALPRGQNCCPTTETRCCCCCHDFAFSVRV